MLEETENLNENSPINLTSLSILSLMAFVYENFDKQIKAQDLQKAEFVKDLIDVIGRENIS